MKMDITLKLKDILEEELGLCLVMYRAYIANDRERRLMIAVWLDALADACLFPGYEDVLRSAFKKHRQEAEKFPVPSQIRPALLEARYKLSINRNEQAGPVNSCPGLGMLYYRAWLGDEEAAGKIADTSPGGEE